MLNNQNRRRARQSRMDQDDLIIIDIRDHADTPPIDRATRIPRFYSKPLPERSVPHSLIEILSMHRNGSEDPDTTHQFIMSGADLSRIFKGETRTPAEEVLRGQLQNGSNNLRASLGLPRRTNS